VKTFDLKVLETQQAILKFHKDFGYYPTVRELMNALGLFSTSNVKTRVDRLAEAGLVRLRESNNQIVWCAELTR
jgi:SOS-response transcriptional repressor LexA